MPGLSISLSEMATTGRQIVKEGITSRHQSDMSGLAVVPAFLHAFRLCDRLFADIVIVTSFLGQPLSAQLV